MKYKNRVNGGKYRKWEKPTSVRKPDSLLLTGSEQQEQFWEELVNGEGDLILQALAGTGKTTTLIQGLLRLDNKGKRTDCILLAFNRSIAEELQQRIPEWAIASTMHSLGNSVCRKNLGNLKPDKWKLDNLLDTLYPEGESHIRDLPNPAANRETWPLIRKAAKSIVSLCKSHLTGLELVEATNSSERRRKTSSFRAPNAEEITELVEKFSVAPIDSDLLESAIQVAQNLWEESIKHTSSIDFDDMLFLPILRNWEAPQYSLVMVDEAQDLNRLQQEWILRLRIQGTGIVTKTVLVGDENQAIYGFRGADCMSMKTMHSLLKWKREDGEIVEPKVLPLTFTRRCPVLHVKRAKSVVPDFEAFPGTKEGEEKFLPLQEIMEEAKPGQMIICRMNAPICLAALKLLKANKPARIQGKDFAEELVQVVYRVARMVVHPEKPSPGKKPKEYWVERKARENRLLISDFLPALEAYQGRELEKLRKRGNTQMAQEIVEDTILCIRAMAEGVKNVGELTERIYQLFTEVESATDVSKYILLSSVHRAKGLESDTVVILQPWLMPHPKAIKPWEKEQERCIQFVAMTRSKNLLVWEMKSKG